MKTRKRLLPFLSLLLVLCLLGAMLGLAGCENGTVSVCAATVNAAGELVLTYTDGHTENLGALSGGSVTAGDNYTISVADGADTTASAAAQGLLSAVSIRCSFTQRGAGSSMGFYPGMGGGQTTYTSAGAGVIYRLDKTAGDAIILTNYHVVYSASCNTDNRISDDIAVYLYGAEGDGQGIAATYVGGSMYYDIAVLRVTDSAALRQSVAAAATFADSDAVTAGSTAIAIGNPQGDGTAVTRGVVSVPSEYISMTTADSSEKVSFRVIRVDTAVNSGNSGGGLYNASGRLIGLVNAKVSDESVENIGYAIPSNVVRAVAENILYYCADGDCETVRRALLGITVTGTDSHAVVDAESGTVHTEETVSVYEVSAGGLCDGVLQAGDILRAVTLNGETFRITARYQLIDRMLYLHAGDTVTLTFVRGGVEATVTLTVSAGHISAY